MGRPKNTELFDRNRRVIEMLAEGHKAEDVAETLGVSRSRVYQIRQEYDADVAPEAQREMHRGHLEFALHTLLPLLRGEGQIKVTPSGRIAYHALTEEDGTPVLDSRGNPVSDVSRPVYDPYAKVVVVDSITRVIGQISKLSALDKDKPPPVKEPAADSSEYEEMMRWVASLTEDQKRLLVENERKDARIAELEARTDVVDAEIVE